MSIFTLIINRSIKLDTQIPPSKFNEKNGNLLDRDCANFVYYFESI